MKRKFLLTLLVLTTILLVACSTEVDNATTQQTTVATQPETVAETAPQTTEQAPADEQPFIGQIDYSNLNDEATQTLLREALLKAGIAEQRVTTVLASIVDYNQTIGGEGLVAAGFKSSEQLVPEYNTVAIDEKWLEKYGEFIGCNCRITAFDLMADNVDIATPDVTENKMLFMDEIALAERPDKTYSESELIRFRTLFGDVPAADSKDIAVHLKEVQDYWQTKGIAFKSRATAEGGASLITVWFHSDLDSNLFVAHTGVLFYDDEGLLFLEKISFQEPYQLLRFANRQALSDYLMNRYDSSSEQPYAKPFIMENDALIEGYRANPNNGAE